VRLVPDDPDDDGWAIIEGPRWPEIDSLPEADGRYVWVKAAAILGSDATYVARGAVNEERKSIAVATRRITGLAVRRVLHTIDGEARQSAEWTFAADDVTLSVVEWEVVPFVVEVRDGGPSVMVRR